MAYNPGIEYHGDRYAYDSIARAGSQFNNFLAGFAMPGTPTEAGPGTPDGGQGPMMPQKPSLMDRFSAGAKSSLEGFDQFKQDADESNALSKLLKTMYPDAKTRIDTMGLGEKRGMLQSHAVEQINTQVQEKQKAQAALARMLQSLGPKMNGAADFAALNRGEGPRALPKMSGRDALISSFAENPQAAQTQAGQGALERLMTQMVSSDEQAGGPPQFTQDPVTGRRFASYGKILMDSGVDPTKALAVNMVDDGSGNKVPVLINAKGGATQLKPGGAKDISPAEKLKSVDAQIRAIRQFPAAMRSADDVQELTDLMTARGELLQGKDAVPAAAPQYKSADEVKTAMANGGLTRDAALKILREQFSYK